MLRAVADTHALIWYIFADQRLSTTARNAMAAATSGGDQIAFLGLPLISRDRRIQMAGVNTIW